MDSHDSSSAPVSPFARTKRRSSAERERILVDFARSGLSQADFAQQHGINLGTFRQWLYSRNTCSGKRGPQPVVTLAAVRLNDRIAAGHDVEVRLRSGLCLAIPLAAGTAAIADLIRQLDRPC